MKNKLLILAVMFSVFQSSFAGIDGFGYSGRLVKNDGKPLTGQVDLRFELAYSDSPTTIEDNVVVNDVDLVNGVFSVELNFPNFDAVYSGLPSDESLFIRTIDITDPLNPVVYDSQNVLANPIARVAERLNITCAQDEVMAFDASGNLVCATNGQGTVGGVSAGSGVLVDNTDPVNPILSANVDNISVDINGSGQLRVKGGAIGNVMKTNASGIAVWGSLYCSTAGEYLKGIDASGNVVCAPDANTALTAGNGIAINGGAIEVKPATGSGLVFSTTELTTDRGILQSRIVNSCGPGYAIGFINQDGSVTCEEVSPNLDGQTTACADNQILKASGGNFVCANAADTGKWSASGSDIYFNSGLVGIGTSTPVRELHISSANTNGAMIKTDSTDTGGKSWVFGSTGSTNATGAGHFGLYNSTDGSYRLVVQDTGNVGIGVLSPTAKLEVSGNIKVSSTSDVCIDGGACLSAAAGGDITDVVAGTGLTGGANSGTATLNVDVGTTAGKIVQLDGTAKLPAVDGSQLTNLPNPTTSTTLSSFATGVDSTITNTDTVETAFEKAQGQINANNSAISANTTAISSKVNNTTTVNGKALSSNVVLNTDDVAEGATNQYFTTGRARTAAVVDSTAGSETTQAASVNSMKNYVTTQISGINQSQWTTTGSDIYFNSGMVGIGVLAPKEILQLGSTWTFRDGATTGKFISNNLFYNGSAWEYLTSDEAVQMLFGMDGSLSVHTYPTGTAGATSSFGASEFTITNSGNVGIGIDSPGTSFPSAKSLHLKGAGRASMVVEGANTDYATLVLSSGPQDSDDEWHFNTYGTTGAKNLNFWNEGNRVTFTQSGNVGIGTTSPLERLHVSASADIVSRMENIAASGKAVTRFSTTQTDGVSRRYSDIGLSSDDGWLGFDAPETSGTGLMGNGGAPEMVLNSQGRVGIGTTAPNTTFHVVDTHGKDIDTIDAVANSGNEWNQHGFKLSTNNNSINFVLSDVLNDRKALIQAGHTSSDYANYFSTMALNPFGGNVGIGVLNPGSALTVNGAIQSVGASGVILHRSTSETGTPTGDGIRMTYEGSVFGTNLDGVVFEKTDANSNDPDGGIAFANTGMDNVRSISMAIRGNGRVGINTISPGYTLHVNGSVAGVGAYNALSDQRYKQNLSSISDSQGSALEKVLALNGKYYEWRQSEYPEMDFEEGRDMGVIAQEVEKVFPEAVSESEKTGIKSVAYSKLIAPLIEALKDLFAKTENDKEELKREIASIKEENKRLKAEQEAMKLILCQEHPEAEFCL